MVGKVGMVFRNNYKGHMDNNSGGGWKQGREVGMAGVVERGGGKCRQLYLNSNKIKKRKKYVQFHHVYST